MTPETIAVTSLKFEQSGFTILAASWQNQQNDVQPAKAQISLGICSVWSESLLYPLSGQRRLWSDWADAQANLGLRWAHRSFCWFCPEAAHKSNFMRKSFLLANTQTGLFSYRSQYQSCNLDKASTCVGFRLCWQWIIKALIRLCECTGWSLPLLFTYGINRFCHDVS